MTAFVSRQSGFGSSIGPIFQILMHPPINAEIQQISQGITGLEGQKKSLKSKISASLFRRFFAFL